MMQRRDFLRYTGGSLAVAGAADSLAAEFGEDRADAYRFGCFTRPFSQFTFAQTLDAIAAAGYSSVGLMTARLVGGDVTLADASNEQVDQIREQATRRQLSISVTYYGGPPVDESLEAGMRAMRRLVANCRRCGCRTILLGGTTREDLFNDYYRTVKIVCGEAAQAGVQLVLKPHGGLNMTGAQCRRIVEHVDHDNFRIWYDPGNIYYYTEGELDPLDDVVEVAGLVSGMCVKDFMPPDQVTINPGSGQVNFPVLMQRLRAGGFRSGPLVVETLAPGDLATTTANARQAHELLRSLADPSRDNR